MHKRPLKMLNLSRREMNKPQKNYATLQSELDNLIELLKSEDTDLDESVILYKKALKLVEEIEKYLKNVELKVKTMGDKEPGEM